MSIAFANEDKHVDGNGPPRAREMRVPEAGRESAQLVLPAPLSLRVLTAVSRLLPPARGAERIAFSFIRPLYSRSGAVVLPIWPGIRMLVDPQDSHWRTLGVPAAPIRPMGTPSHGVHPAAGRPVCGCREQHRGIHSLGSPPGRKFRPGARHRAGRAVTTALWSATSD